MGTGSLESEVAGTLPRETREKGCVWPSHGRRLHFWPALSLPFLKAVKAKVPACTTLLCYAAHLPLVLSRVRANRQSCARESTTRS